MNSAFAFAFAFPFPFPRVSNETFFQLAMPSTILALESIIRDGTLFCTFVESCLLLPVKPYHLKPHSWQQCLSNTQKALDQIRKSIIFAEFFMRFKYYFVVHTLTFIKQTALF